MLLLRPPSMDGSPRCWSVCYVPFFFLLLILSLQLLVQSGTDGTLRLLMYELRYFLLLLLLFLFCCCLFSSCEGPIVSVFNPGGVVQISNSAEFVVAEMERKGREEGR